MSSPITAHLGLTQSEARAFERLPLSLRNKILTALKLEPMRDARGKHWAERRSARCYEVRTAPNQKPTMCTLEEAAAIAGCSAEWLGAELSKQRGSRREVIVDSSEGGTSVKLLTAIT